MHPAVNVMIKAARRASQKINRAAQDIEHVRISVKQQNDFVTEVDKAAEEAILSVLCEAYPDYAVMAEESAPEGKNPKESDYQWIIDPLDGTMNFIHSFPHYAISIALSCRGQLQHGVVYDPVRNEMYTASRGGGAFLNDRRMRVSQKIRLSEALLGTGFPFSSFARVDTFLAEFKTLTEKSAGIRRGGAAALDLAYVAAGRLDGFWQDGLKPWDMAAGALLIAEAGGLVCDFDGNDHFMETGRLVTAPPKILPQIMSALASVQAST